MAEIRINLNQAYCQARQLDDAASDLKQVLQTLLSEKQSIPSYWDGTAAHAFIGKLEAQYNELSSLCKQLESVADRIRTVADRLKRQEEAAQQAALKL